MFPTVETLLQIVKHDLDPDFVEALAVDVAWEYSALYNQIASEPDLPDDFRQEQFAKRRGYSVATALKRTAIVHRVPYEFIRLECNGQQKLIVKAGRVLLIQEPILTLDDAPKATDYKVSLANIHGLMSQAELDLGDRGRRIQDWSGCVLGVLLHGASGPHFTKEQRMLGGLMLGITDASYSQWVLRVDLHQIAMFGRGTAPQQQIINPVTGPVPSQPDNVFVTPKKKKIDKGST